MANSEANPTKFIIVDEARNGVKAARVQAIRECGLGRHMFCVRVLGENLRDSDPEIRHESARNLGLLAHPEAVPYAAAALGRETDLLNLADLIWVIGMCGAATESKLIAGYLDHENEFIRRETALALAKLRSPDTMQLLTERRKKEPLIRVQIILLQCEIATDRTSTSSIAELILRLTDRDPAVRYWAAESVGVLELKEATPVLEKQLRLEAEENVYKKLSEVYKIVRLSR